jgi:hypothetical protein
VLKKNLKLTAVQHQKNKRVESTQLADPRLRNAGIEDMEMVSFPSFTTGERVLDAHGTGSWRWW